MSKSIDYHEGYIQALTDMQKEFPAESKLSVRDAITQHTIEIGKILEEMHKEYQKKNK